MDLMMQMIESEDAIEKHQHAIGNIKVILGMFANAFEAPHNVVSAISDGASGEWRQAFEFGGTMLLQEFFYDFKDITGAAFEFAAALDRDFFAARLQTKEGTHAKKCVASDFFSAFDGFEQEGVGLSVSNCAINSLS